MATRLFVGNIPDNLNEDSLREVFTSYGKITNLDIKTKPGNENDKKKFAFITLSSSNFNIESCIKYFCNEEFQGNKLYVTRARESFLERLQRERDQSQKKIEQVNPVSEANNSNENYNFQKRKIDSEFSDNNYIIKTSKVLPVKDNCNLIPNFKEQSNKASLKNNIFENDEKKLSSDKKRLESMRKKRQEFNEKKNIIKSGLITIDKKANKKVLFSDTEENAAEDTALNGNGKSYVNRKVTLFDDEMSDEEINFEIKEQFEGKRGQKVLDLQSRFKSDKRFALDKRFVDEENEKEEPNYHERDEVDVGQADEKSKQLNILQDVLGIPIKIKQNGSNNKTKPKLGMLRFDPMHPDHAKFFAPVEPKKEPAKKTKKKKNKDKEPTVEEQVAENEPVTEKIEVSKEQFYKISDTLKEAITQPNEFSLRSLFTREDAQEETKLNQDKDYIPIKPKKDPRTKNPLDLGEKNPFVYDSSESDSEENEKGENMDSKLDAPEINETKPVWREKLFFSSDDFRLRDGLLFFSKKNEYAGNKERRELKSLMKKRIYNKERKNTLFQKKIGGRKKMMKKKIRNK